MNIRKHAQRVESHFLFPLRSPITLAQRPHQDHVSERKCEGNTLEEGEIVMRAYRARVPNHWFAGRQIGWPLIVVATSGTKQRRVDTIRYEKTLRIQGLMLLTKSVAYREHHRRSARGFSLLFGVPIKIETLINEVFDHGGRFHLSDGVIERPVQGSLEPKPFGCLKDIARVQTVDPCAHPGRTAEGSTARHQH